MRHGADDVGPGRNGRSEIDIADVGVASRDGLDVDLYGAAGVRQECLDYALDRPEPDGIFGGLTPQERRDILARRSA